jgi:hypothetical protein
LIYTSHKNNTFLKLSLQNINKSIDKYFEITDKKYIQPWINLVINTLKINETSDYYLIYTPCKILSQKHSYEDIILVIKSIINALCSIFRDSEETNQYLSRINSLKSTYESRITTHTYRNEFDKLGCFSKKVLNDIINIMNMDGFHDYILYGLVRCLLFGEIMSATNFSFYEEATQNIITGVTKLSAPRNIPYLPFCTKRKSELCDGKHFIEHHFDNTSYGSNKENNIKFYIPFGKNGTYLTILHNTR